MIEGESDRSSAPMVYHFDGANSSTVRSLTLAQMNRMVWQSGTRILN